MICKWCGAGVSPAEKKCPRCGREIPALSDCGGFYDIAPRMPRDSGAAKEVPAPAVSAPVAASPERKNQGKGAVILALIGIVAVTVLAVILVMQIGKVSELESLLYSKESALEEAYETIESLEQQVGTEKPTDPAEPTDPEKPTNPEITTKPQDSDESDPPNPTTEPTDEPAEQKHLWSVTHDWIENPATVTMENQADSEQNLVFTSSCDKDPASGEITFTYGNQDVATTVTVTVSRDATDHYKVSYKVEGVGLGEYPVDTDKVEVTAWNGWKMEQVSIKSIAVDNETLFFEFVAEKLKKCEILWNGDNGECLTLSMTGLEETFDSWLDGSEE